MSQVARGAALQAEWDSQERAWRDRDPELAAEWDAAWAGRPLPGVGEALRSVSFSKDGLATRVAGKESMAAMAPFVPTLVGGAADLSGSTNTMMPGGESAHYTERQAGRNVYFGVREHGMGGAVNGMAAHGGIVRPYGSTFLQFADYMRGSIRLSALMGLQRRLGLHARLRRPRRGRPHAPAGRAPARAARDPAPHGLRPADAAETAEAWRVILEDLDGPGVLALSRQGVPSFGRGEGGVADATGLARGAYVLRDAQDARATVVGTGTEVTVALAAADLLAGEGIPTRVVSMPSWELFDAQDLEYQEATIPVELVVRLRRGGRHDGLGALGRQRRRDRPLRRVGPGAGGAGAPGHHARGGRPARARPARLTPPAPLNLRSYICRYMGGEAQVPPQTGRIARGPHGGPRAMELGGLEPPTSWVRSRRSPN